MCCGRWPAPIWTSARRPWTWRSTWSPTATSTRRAACLPACTLLLWAAGQGLPRFGHSEAGNRRICIDFSLM